MTEIITINNVDLNILEYKEKNVVTFKMIDKVHERPEGTARKRFSDNKKRFSTGRHFYKVCQSEFRTDLWESFGFSKLAATGALITERGYLLLVKSFTDDLAWDVQEKLIDGYFQSKGKVLTPGQQLALQAQFMIDTERRQLKLEKSQRKTEVAILETKQKIDELESKICSNPGYFTVTGYANLMKVRVTTQEANKIGRKAAKLSRESNTAIGKSSHERWGEVNTYHENILKAIFPRK